MSFSVVTGGLRRAQSSGGRRLFVTYLWRKPWLPASKRRGEQWREQVSLADKSLKRPARHNTRRASPGALSAFGRLGTEEKLLSFEHLSCTKQSFVPRSSYCLAPFHCRDHILGLDQQKIPLLDPSLEDSSDFQGPYV